MRKGFTLIELLAVIVILAIISLIVVPITTNIINNTKEASRLRSAEFYLDAVELAIMDKNLFQVFEPKSCIINTSGNLLCDDNKVVEIKTKGEKPNGGSITFENNKVLDAKIKFKDIVIVKNTNGKLVISDDKEICVPVTEDTVTTGNIPKGNYEIGDEYICEVKPGVSYHFFVVGVEGDKVNMIMDRNIVKEDSI